MLPKVLHQFWDEGPVPDVFARFAEGWQRLHPDWRYAFWSGGRVPPLQNQDLYANRRRERGRPL